MTYTQNFRPISDESLIKSFYQPGITAVKISCGEHNLPEFIELLAVGYNGLALHRDFTVSLETKTAELEDTFTITHVLTGAAILRRLSAEDAYKIFKPLGDAADWSINPLTEEQIATYKTTTLSVLKVHNVTPNSL